jgi:hypothetical protein
MSSGPARNRDRWFTTFRWTLLAAAVADLAVLKAGLVSHPHIILAFLMAAVMLAFGVRVVQLGVLRFLRPSRPVRSYARMAVAAGIFIAVGGGLANWMLGLQGYVILTEQEKARLHRGAELQGFEPGPLADIDELEVVLGLDELDLVPSGTDAFFPASHLRVWQGHSKPASLRISPRESAAAGSLRFHQGAFGFAPRIVILKKEVDKPEETVFDKVVPFLTERRGPEKIYFNGSFAIEEADLHVEGSISLDSLDEGMRGHATLDLTVMRGEQPLGRGSLLPGHFAELEGGYRVGFAGLNMWSEIVISRRNYGTMVLAGTILAIIGTFLLLLALWRGW